jgi:hypothetical protein
MASQDEINRQVQRASEVQARYADQLMNKPNVVGLGVGFTTKSGQSTGAVGLIVMVDRKLPVAQLAPEDLIPAELDGVPVDVQETGVFSAT